MTCRKCGFELRSDAKFCDKCGAKVENSSSVERNEKKLYEAYIDEFNSAKKQIRKKKVRRCLVCWIVALMAVLVGLFCYINREVKENMELVMIVCIMVVAGFFPEGIRSLIYTSSADRKMLEQINQAYENANMINKINR